MPTGKRFFRMWHVFYLGREFVAPTLDECFRLMEVACEQ